MRLTTLSLLFALSWPLSGQNQFFIKKATGNITIDANMNEPDWQSTQIATGFRQYFPFDSSMAKAQTEVRMTYDDKFLYIYAVMHNNEPRKYVTPSLRRDFRGEANDGFVMQLDTYQDKTNAFSFGVNPFGVQREGLISNGGNDRDNLSLDWDNKWYSEARILDDRWECEMAIPFKTLRYKEGLSAWNINFYRIDSHLTERSTWVPIPRNIPIISLAYTNELIWDTPLRKLGPNISLIPYVAGTANKDFEKLNTQHKPEIGGDAKIAISSALNLDLTVNPNFAQVEVDQQVTNLDRFEIFYPEKRQFFLENADLFANFGSQGAQPFFSRRIGVSKSNSTGQNINNPIYGGLRLSGKLNNNWRVGLLSMQTQEKPADKVPSTNYSVGVIQRKIFARSNISAIVVNKKSFPDTTRGNTMIGVDYNLASKNGKFAGKYYYHQSFNGEVTQKDSAFSAGARIDYTSNKVEFSVVSRTVGANYNPEAGFVRRKRFNQIAPEFYYWFYPKSRIVNRHGPGMDVDVIWNDLYGKTDWDANLWYQVRFQNTANFFIRIRQDYVYLWQNFDASGAHGEEFQVGDSFYYTNIVYNYQSNARKKVFFNINGRIGEYFNGHRQNVAGTLSLRLQPRAIISLDLSYNRIRLPKPYSHSDLLVVSPRFDLTFNRKLFWTTYIQYNNQINNVNFNTRLQWRFKPVSDLFIVYTDNYATEAYTTDEGVYINKYGPKLRAISIKLSYWFNL